MSFVSFASARSVYTLYARTHLAISLAHSIVTQSTFCFSEQDIEGSGGEGSTATGTGWVIERNAATLFFVFAATYTLSFRLTELGILVAVIERN